jgi:hypothetical protein
MNYIPENCSVGDICDYNGDFIDEIEQCTKWEEEATRD